MTEMNGAESPPPGGEPHAVIDCRAPRHDRGANRLLVAPGAVSVGTGAGGHAVVLVRAGRPDGSVESLYRGTSLYGTAEVATGAVRDRRPDAVWITDRSYLRRHWSPWTVDRLESRLADAAEGVDAPLVAWTGAAREAGSDGASGSGRRGYAEP